MPTRISAGSASFEFAVVWTTIAATALFGVPDSVTSAEWIAFALLTPLIAVTHLAASYREKFQGSHLSLAPIFASVLVLPPLLTVAAIALAFVIEWARTRLRWYIVVFNVANFAGPALAARAAFDAWAPHTSSTAWSVGAVSALLVFVLLHYGVLATMLRLARGVRVAETIRLDCVVIDAGLLSLGAAGAALWQDSAGRVVLTLLPLARVYRSLAIPRLVEASRVEPKTGLFNMRHFDAALAQELARAGRFDRRVALLMVDVDHLREVNNTRGHVAGDAALRLVADTIRAATREYDVAARFGGDEFAVLLPETDEPGALAVAERIRAGVESAGRAAAIGVTVSVGVAADVASALSPEELIALADRAAYRAKFSGRNTVAVPPAGDPVDEAERLLLDAVAC
ncbi:MAG: GGDEF domain-containing protein [Actinobacteria bacterium]|nr:GGDEF domain-containing protein [Actinomycetota bacterium]